MNMAVATLITKAADNVEDWLLDLDEALKSQILNEVKIITDSSIAL